MREPAEKSEHLTLHTPLLERSRAPISWPHRPRGAVSRRGMPTALAKSPTVAEPKAAAPSAAEMGARQREISVSEFFTKNRHLLGFDNPRKALLTCVKEAVDNALDACEEAGILPEVVVTLEVVAEQRRRAAAGQPGDPLPRHRAGQRPRHRPPADPADLRQAALRLEVPPPAHEPRPAGHRHLRRRHVRAAHHRQAGADHLAHRRAAPRPTTSRCRSTPRRTSRGSSRARRSTGSTRAAPR